MPQTTPMHYRIEMKASLCFTVSAPEGASQEKILDLAKDALRAAIDSEGGINLQIGVHQPNHDNARLYPGKGIAEEFYPMQIIDSYEPEPTHS